MIVEPRTDERTAIFLELSRAAADLIDLRVVRRVQPGEDPEASLAKARERVIRARHALREFYAREAATTPTEAA